MKTKITFPFSSLGTSFLLLTSRLAKFSRSCAVFWLVKKQIHYQFPHWELGYSPRPTKKEIWDSNYYFPENPFGNYKIKNFQFPAAHKEERIVNGKLHVVRSTDLFWQMVSSPLVATLGHPEVSTRVGHYDRLKSSAYQPIKLYKHF